jgi:hypothetical protein
MISTKEFLAFSNIITSVVIDAIINLSKSIAATNSILIKSLSSIITIKSYHDTFFHITNSKVPNSAPFNIEISNI